MDNTATPTIEYWLPNDIWAVIATFLDSDELASFKQVCQSFYGIGSQDMMLQPLYNRLRAIDNTLPAELETAANATQKTSLVFFKEAFEKIKAKQQQEMTYLTQHHPDLMAKPEYAAALAQNTSVSLKSLETKSAVLDAINSEIITATIDKDVNSTRLDLCGAHITRLPVTLFNHADYANFWQNLIDLLCSDNQLTELNLQKLSNLQGLNCENNPIEKLNLQGLSLLAHIYCRSSHRIPYLNLTGAHPNVQSYFSDEQLRIRAMWDNRFAESTRKNLFNVLSSSDSLEERQKAITQLGSDYTYKNCLYYCPGYTAKLFISDSMSMLGDITSYALRQFSNYLPLSIANLNATATPSNDVQMTEEKESDNKPEDKHRKNN